MFDVGKGHRFFRAPRRIHRLLRKRKVVTVYESADGQYYLRYVLKPGVDKSLSDLTVLDIDWVQKRFPKRVQARYVREVALPMSDHRKSLMLALLDAFGLRGGERLLKKLQDRGLPLVLRRTLDVIRMYQSLTMGVVRYNRDDFRVSIERDMRRRYRRLEMARLRRLMTEPVDLDADDLPDRLHDAFLVAKAYDVPVEALSGYPILLILHAHGDGMTMLAPHGVVYPTDVSGLLLALGRRVTGTVMEQIGRYIESARALLGGLTRRRRDVRVDAAFPHDMVRGYFYQDGQTPVEPMVRVEPAVLERMLDRLRPSFFGADNATLEEDGTYDEAKWSKWVKSNY